MEILTPEADYLLRFINQTSKNIFLTGKAGTGKTTLLKTIIQTTHKNTVVVAPTGIAALNAGGVTIHSMFQLPFGGFLPVFKNDGHFTDSVKFESKDTLRRHFKMSGLKKSVIRNMELLIIDEVSMLRCDLLDAIDYMLQSVRKNDQSFGGVQVLFIGDLLQLPPVVRDEEWRTLKQFYKGKFFFHSHAIGQNPPLYIELSKIFRQTDDRFISILNNLRNNQISPADIETLNQFVQPNFDLKNNKGYIILTTHNAKADAINTQSINDLNGNKTIFSAEIIGEFPEKIFPIDAQLELKVGAQIMFVKNDPAFEKNYFNGKMGIVKSLSDNEIFVHFPDENKTIEVEKYEWQNIRYTLNPNTKEIEEEILGTFVHYPIKLAWAITVHKSQGLTFDKAALDVSQVFMPGQAYVALSRLRSLDGLVLLSPLQMNGISNDQEVMEYAENKASENDLADKLKDGTKEFILAYLQSGFDWENLSAAWRSHRFSYNEKSEVSEKSKHASWAKNQCDSIENLLKPAQQFRSQLRQLFSETPDFEFVKSRVDAATDYFFPTMEKLTDEILYKIEEIKRVKKVKAFYEELAQLEEMQTKAVLQLMKARLLIATIVAGESISKEKLTSEAIKNYRSDKLEKIRRQFKDSHAELIENEEDHERYTTKKKSKQPKKDTVLETLQLWQQRNTIKEIATLRKLTPQTICNHMAKLIASETIQITDVLPEDKIAGLTEIFKGFKGEALSELKEKYGNQFSWDELKMFKASL